MRNMILASSSSIHGSGYLEYLQPQLSDLFKNCNQIVFIPYAQPNGISYDEYTKIAQEGFRFMNKKVVGIHTFSNPVEAMENAEAVFIGGGNTFVLVAKMYAENLWKTLLKKINNGLPYFGTSAGTNICGVSMQTTNDMPIVPVTSYKTLGVLPFNINAHFIKLDPKSTHKGETRETRIREFHQFNDTAVLGLPEGNWLEVKGSEIVLKGVSEAFWFEKEKEVEIYFSEKRF